MASDFRVDRPASIFGKSDEAGIFATMRKEMDEKKTEETPVVFEKQAEAKGDFYGKVNEDDGIDVPIFLRKGQE